MLDTCDGTCYLVRLYTQSCSFDFICTLPIQLPSSFNYAQNIKLAYANSRWTLGFLLNNDIYVTTKLTSGQTWPAAVNMTDDSNSVIVGEFNFATDITRVLLVYRGGSTGTEIFAKEFDPANLVGNQVPRQITSPAINCSFPSAAVIKQSDDWAVVYQCGVGTAAGLYLSYGSPGSGWNDSPSFSSNLPSAFNSQIITNAIARDLGGTLIVAYISPDSAGAATLYSQGINPVSTFSYFWMKRALLLELFSLFFIFVSELLNLF